MYNSATDFTIPKITEKEFEECKHNILLLPMFQELLRFNSYRQKMHEEGKGDIVDEYDRQFPDRVIIEYL